MPMPVYLWSGIFLELTIIDFWKSIFLDGTNIVGI